MPDQVPRGYGSRPSRTAPAIDFRQFVEKYYPEYWHDGLGDRICCAIDTSPGGAQWHDVRVVFPVEYSPRVSVNRLFAILGLWLASQGQRVVLASSANPYFPDWVPYARRAVDLPGFESVYTIGDGEFGVVISRDTDAVRSLAWDVTLMADHTTEPGSFPEGIENALGACRELQERRGTYQLVEYYPTEGDRDVYFVRNDCEKRRPTGDLTASSSRGDSKTSAVEEYRRFILGDAEENARKFSNHASVRVGPTPRYETYASADCAAYTMGRDAVRRRAAAAYAELLNTAGKPDTPDKSTTSPAFANLRVNIVAAFAALREAIATAADRLRQFARLAAKPKRDRSVAATIRRVAEWRPTVPSKPKVSPMKFIAAAVLGAIAAVTAPGMIQRAVQPHPAHPSAAQATMFTSHPSAMPAATAVATAEPWTEVTVIRESTREVLATGSGSDWHLAPVGPTLVEDRDGRRFFLDGTWGEAGEEFRAPTAELRVTETKPDGWFD